MKISCKTLALFLSASLSLTFLSGCSQEDVVETAEDVAIVEAGNPVIGDIKLSGEFIATLNPESSVYVIPKTTAEVLEVLVEEGDVVEAGDVLAILDDTLAQLSMKSAQINLDNAQRAYNLSYGEGASILSDMQSDNTLSRAEDNVTQLQESLVDAMDALQRSKDDLKEAEQEYADFRADYDFVEDIDEIKDYADTFDFGSDDYNKAMARYQEAVTIDTRKQFQAKIDGYKSAIDQYEDAIETIYDNIDSAYEAYGQAVTSANISNGELRDDQRQVSENSISAAQLSIEQAKESLDAYTITATISGVIEAVNIDEHNFATSSSPAFIISNKNKMTATYYVSEDVRNTFSIGQKVSIEKDGQTYDGEVVEIGSAVDTATGLFLVKANVDGDTSKMLSGTKATVTTDTYHENNVIIIPYDSVYYDGEQAYMYTVVEGTARRTNITTGLYDTQNIVVTDGITMDDVIITTWSAQLREGVTVLIREASIQE